MANIRARGRLIVGVDIGSNLFSFRDPITGDIVGFDVDIAGEVARDIFGNPSQVEYRILSSAERITALEKAEVDVVVKTMTITCDRRKQVNFSTVYLDAAQRILAPRDSAITKPADLSGKRVCVARGTTSLERIREISPPPMVVEVVNWADCLVTLQQREVDAVSTDDSILAGLVSQDPISISSDPIWAPSLGIGVKLDNTGLVRFVNGTWKLIRRDGTVECVYPAMVDGARARPRPPSPEGMWTDGRGPQNQDTELSSLPDPAGRWDGRFVRQNVARWPPRRSSDPISTMMTRTMTCRFTSATLSRRNG